MSFFLNAIYGFDVFVSPTFHVGCSVFLFLLQKGTLLVYSPSQRHLGSIMLIRIQHPELVSTQFTIPTLVSLLMSSFIILLDCSHFFVFFLSFSPIQKSVVV